MTIETRRAVAYIAGRLVSGKSSSAIYDYQVGNHSSFSGSVDGNRVSVYDQSRSCHLTGAPSSLYDYGGNHHIQLNVQGQRFSGYDYGSSGHFNGRVNGKSISLYDYEHGSHFDYSI